MDVICGACGQRNPSGHRFCSACDRYLDKTSVEVPSEDELESTMDDAQLQPPRDTDEDPAAVPNSHRVLGGPTPTRPRAALITIACPVCRTDNRPELRFCRKCGHVLVDRGAAAVPTAPAESQREGWWTRLKQRFTPEGSGAARAAYRRSLPLRYRLVRWVAFGLLGVVLVAIPLLVGNGAIEWVRDLL